MVSVGDHVVYRHHVCTVSAVREKYYQDRDYLELHALFENSLKLFVAIDEAKPPALRPVMTYEEANDLIDSIGGVETMDPEELAEKSDTSTLLDRRIKEAYDKHLKTFSPEELLPIMQFAYNRSQSRNSNGRNATATDMRYFNLALNLLCDELTVSLGIDRDKINDYLDRRVRSNGNLEQDAPSMIRTSLIRH